MKNILTDTKNKYPKVLVISNNSLSENNSNGRTLASFLRGWSKDRIAQIYVTGEMPESTVCDNFFRITDKDIIKGFINRQNIGQILHSVKSSTTHQNNISGKKIKKTILTMMIRDMLWSTNIWHTKKLDNWIKAFAPDIILFFAGESCFTYNITRRIADKYKLTIVAYNSEGYYFKEKNYLKGSVLSELLYPAFHKRFREVFRCFMQNTKAIIYANNKLKNDYDNEFKHNSYVIYTASEVEFECRGESNTLPIISYLGNLGVGRDRALAQIASALQEINTSYKLDVYGKIPNDEVKNTFDNNPGINYCGLVSYDKVIEVMHNSDLIVHGESFDDFTIWDLKYAFTTKIADSLSCGTCFFIYAPKELACTEYLLENDCACVVTEQDKLKSTLEEILNNEELRKKYISKALKIAEQNHNTEKNCAVFREILCEGVNNENNAD